MPGSAVPGVPELAGRWHAMYAMHREVPAAGATLVVKDPFRSADCVNPHCRVLSQS
jgi:hypothetical protein